MMRSSAAKRLGRRQLRQVSDLKEQIESATASRFSSSMGLADSFARLRPRPLHEKRSNSSRLGESTPETRLVQVRILLPQPATRGLFSPQRDTAPKSRVYRHFLTRQRHYKRRERSGNRPFQGHMGQKYPPHMMVLTLPPASPARRFLLLHSA